MTETTPPRGAWKSKAGFILAAAGSAVGLGNIWKFPYITGENGGGLFVLIYLVCILLVGLPIMMAEIMIGRAAQKQPVVAFHVLQGRRTAWAGIGWLGLVAGFVILSYYIVVAGWAMDYTFKAVVNVNARVHETAEKDAAAYRATAPIEDMRRRVSEHRAERAVRADVDRIKKDVPHSIWVRYEKVYEETIAAAPDPAAAAMRLAEDRELAETLKAVAPKVERIASLTAEARRRADAEVASMADAEVRDLAQAIHRRSRAATEVKGIFDGLRADGAASTFWAALFMVITIFVVATGVSGGIERTCRILMPALLAIIVFMVIYAVFTRGFGEGLRFVFAPDASKLKARGILEALGHSFFTLSLGMGAMITYGSYQKERTSLLAQSGWIAGLDTLIALLACLMMFPVLFSYDQDPAGGPGLVFQSMPLAFSEIGRGGMLLAILFFGLLVFAALTSSISLLEVVASYFIDEKGWSRRKAAWILGTAIFAFGIPCAVPGLFPAWEAGFGQNYFDTMDYLASNWMLPIGGLFIAIYAGWAMPARLRDAELQGIGPALVKGWTLVIRFVAPLLVVVVLLDKVGILKIDELIYRMTT